MAKAKPLSKVDPYFRSLQPKLKVCAEKLRKTIYEIEPNANEQLLWGRPCYSVNNEVCYISVAKDHVKLEFARSNEFEDIKIKDPGNIDADVKTQIENAFKLDAAE